MQVDDYYRVNPRRPVINKYGIPFGIILFSLIIYVSFIRPYGDKDKEKFDYISKNVDRILVSKTDGDSSVSSDSAAHTESSSKQK